MAESLSFRDPQVQGTLCDITLRILTSDLIKGVNDCADFGLRITRDRPAAHELIHAALGAEALFAVWRQPIDMLYDNILHIVKVDIQGAIIPGSETMVGTVYDDRVVGCAGEFMDEGVWEIERFAQQQEQLPWHPDASMAYAFTD